MKTGLKKLKFVGLFLLIAVIVAPTSLWYASKMGLDKLTTGIPDKNLEFVKIIPNTSVSYSYSAHAGAVNNGIDSSAIFSFPHNLGYKPVVMAFIEDTSVGQLIPISTGSVEYVTFSQNYSVIVHWNIIVTTTDVTINTGMDYWVLAANSTPSISATRNIKFYLLRERAS